MRVHTVTKQHANAAIAAMGMTPITKQPLPVNTIDDRTTGKLFAQECIALVVGHASPWRDLAVRAFGMTVEARAAAVKAMDAWIKAKREENEEVTGADEKLARKRLASATVELSKMRTTINAINGGMTTETIEKYFDNTFENIGWNGIVEVARTFSKSTAGRKPDTLLVKLGKWIEVQKKGQPETAEDRKLLDDLIKFFNDHAE